MHEGQHFPTPYMTIMDWGHDERDYAAGHQDKAPRLSDEEWSAMMRHIRGICRKAQEYGVRPVIHPHAGGYIEFADEIEKLVKDIPYEIAGLCLDTGHLYYSGMDPATWLKKYQKVLDYVHFKDVNETVYREVMKQHIRFLRDVELVPCVRLEQEFWIIRESEKHWRRLTITDILPLSRSEIQEIPTQV